MCRRGHDSERQRRTTRYRFPGTLAKIELIVAMEARCYVSGAGRTKFVVLKSSTSDYLAVAGAFIFMLVMIFIPWPAIRTVAALFGFNGL